MIKAAAGITVCEPDIERLQENIAAILPQVERLYLVDNASHNTSALKYSLCRNEKIVVLENNRNLGIATALNQLCRAADAAGFEWILTLDQDSVADSDLIEKYSRYTADDAVAIICPRFVDDNEPQIIHSERPTSVERVQRCNTSASLVRLSAYRAVGGFDDAMFIDYVDFDFCTALTEHDFVILRDNEAVLHHRLGHAQEIRFFMPLGRLLGIAKLQKPMFTYNHSPQRTYYYVRNLHYYIYKHRKTVSAAYERKVCFRWMMLKLLFEKQRPAQLKAALRGMRDARKMIAELKKKGK